MSPRPTGRDAGEEAGAAFGDREVGDVADVAVEDRGGGRLRRRRFAAGAAAPPRARIMPKAERSTPTGSRPASRSGLQRGGDHVAAGGDDDHVDLRRGAVDRADAADHPVVDHRLVERHRDLLLGREADRRVQLLRVLDRRQAQGAHDDALVGDAEPHPLGELVLGEEAAQRLGDGVGVGDLAVVEGLGRQRRGRGGGDAGRAVDLHFGRGDAAGLDLEPDRAEPLFLFFWSREIIGRVAMAYETPTPQVLDRPIGRKTFGLQVPRIRKTGDQPMVSRPITQSAWTGAMKLGGVIVVQAVVVVVVLQVAGAAAWCRPGRGTSARSRR